LVPPLKKATRCFRPVQSYGVGSRSSRSNRRRRFRRVTLQLDPKVSLQASRFSHSYRELAPRKEILTNAGVPSSQTPRPSRNLQSPFNSTRRSRFQASVFSHREKIPLKCATRSFLPRRIGCGRCSRSSSRVGGVPAVLHRGSSTAWHPRTARDSTQEKASRSLTVPLQSCGRSLEAGAPAVSEPDGHPSTRPEGLASRLPVFPTRETPPQEKAARSFDYPDPKLW